MYTAKRLFGLAICIAGLFSSVVQAQEYPSRPVTFIVPYGAGSATEQQARFLAEHLQNAWKVAVLVEARPGAGGVIGANAVAKASPDGYTMLYTGANMALFKVVSKELPFDPLKDFTPISLVVDYTSIFFTNSQFKTIDELIAYAKANPGKLNYGSAGRNSPMLMVEALKRATGMQMVEIPYAGQAQYVTALLRNDVQLVQGALAGGVKGQVDSGLLRPLLVVSERRLPAYPNVPTSVEKGWAIPRNGWSGVFAPAGTPTSIINRMATEIARFVAIPEAQKRAQDVGAVLMSSTPEQFRKQIEDEARMWVDVAAAIGLKPE